MTLDSALFTPQEEQLSALVVDDDRLFRRLISEILNRQGYKTFEGANGKEAVQLCQEHRPDILLIDISMPELDGISAVTIIKDQMPDHLMPIIFITSTEDDSTLTRCIVAGGDEFITKPFNPTVLRTKLIAIERNRSMYLALLDLHNRQQRDQEIAEQLFNKAVMSSNVAFKGLKSYLRPAATFSGDVLLTAIRPNGDLSVLIGDFTGHGLAAAIGAMPVADTFRAMTSKGYSGGEIMTEISKKLCKMLPTGMFFSSAFVTISHEYRTVSVWNCGMPDALLMTSQPPAVKASYSSKSPPLGIKCMRGQQIESQVDNLAEGDVIFLCSDGVEEARNPDGEYFGNERFISTLMEGLQQGHAINCLAQTLDSFAGDHPIEDDITLAEIPFLSSGIQPRPVSQRQTNQFSHGERWQWRVKLENQMLRQTDLVPLTMSQMQALLPSTQHVDQIFTVFTELYLNALEHGVLGLPSSMKSSAEGFARYFAEKENRLNSLTSGWVDVSLEYHSTLDRAQLRIDIIDSGDGFDVDKWLRRTAEKDGLSGRGLALVLELTTELSYKDEGNHVTAVLEWALDEESTDGASTP